MKRILNASLLLAAALTVSGCLGHGHGYPGNGYYGGGGVHPSDRNPGYFAGQLTNPSKFSHPSYWDPNYMARDNPHGYWAGRGHGVHHGGHNHHHGRASVSVNTGHVAGSVAGRW